MFFGTNETCESELNMETLEMIWVFWHVFTLQVFESKKDPGFSDPLQQPLKLWAPSAKSKAFRCQYPSPHSDDQETWAGRKPGWKGQNSTQLKWRKGTHKPKKTHPKPLLQNIAQEGLPRVFEAIASVMSLIFRKAPACQGAWPGIAPLPPQAQAI